MQTFKMAHSAYLLKYYVCNQNDFPFKNSIIMDYIPHNNTLIEFLRLQKDTISLKSKFHLAANLSNGLRFIKNYGVVHMDLTMTNVLVVNDYLTKIIDFGESYSKTVTEEEEKNWQSYYPGFTLPYCPPETFNKLKVFDSSQDAFSFGILLYKMLINSHPFFPSDELIPLYQKRTYNSRFMLCPEGVEQFLHQKVSSIFLFYISKCMSEDAEERPLPSWSAFILR